MSLKSFFAIVCDMGNSGRKTQGSLYKGVVAIFFFLKGFKIDKKSLLRAVLETPLISLTELFKFLCGFPNTLLFKFLSNLKSLSKLPIS